MIRTLTTLLSRDPTIKQVDKSLAIIISTVDLPFTIDQLIDIFSKIRCYTYSLYMWKKVNLLNMPCIRLVNFLLIHKPKIFIALGYMLINNKMKTELMFYFLENLLSMPVLCNEKDIALDLSDGRNTMYTFLCKMYDYQEFSLAGLCMDNNCREALHLYVESKL